VLLLDNSAWSRRRLPAVRKSVEAAMESAQLSVCLPFLLEAGYSARSATDHTSTASRLALLPRIEITPRIESLALEAQRELARVGHHRLTPMDVIIAACAHDAEAGVLHYDGDYDLLRKHTSLRFKSVWAAKRGTL
jgi:predicted nucleic acid-binding protein